MVQTQAIRGPQLGGWGLKIAVTFGHPTTARVALTWWRWESVSQDPDVRFLGQAELRTAYKSEHIITSVGR